MASEVLNWLGQPSVAAALGATAVTAVAGAYLFGTPASLTPVMDASSLNNQTVQNEDGSYSSRRAQKFSHELEYIDKAFGPGKRTMLDVFNMGMSKSKNSRCVGQCKSDSEKKPYYEWLTYHQVHGMAQECGSGLLGKVGKRQGFVGVYAQNRTEWVVTELACYMYSLVPVPLYDTLGAESCTYIINLTEMSLVVCDKDSKVLSLLKDHDKHKGLQHIVCMEAFSEQSKNQAAAAGVSLLLFTELLQQGRDANLPLDPPKEDDLAIICFTSGTTGNPKGVMLTHLGICSNIAACYHTIQDTCPLQADDSVISFLPLAHMFERLAQYALLGCGGSIGIFRGDVRLLMEDIKALRPTVMPIVPRLLNRMYDKVEAGVKNSRIKSWLFRTALSKKAALLKQGVVTNSSIWDKLVFGRVQATLGGRVRFMITGSAPLDPKVMEFARCAIGCTILEGYGQTECVAGITFQLPGDITPGSVGCPMACCRVKLFDVPEMQYYHKDGKGEVCVKGRNTSLGYYREPEKTRELLDEDGWLHTGDIGMWLPNGALKIIDRKKHIFKLAQGEYIAPEKIENIYARSEVVAQCFVEGDSLKPNIVAVVCPDLEVFPDWCQQKGFTGSVEELCQNEQVKKAVLEDITKVGKNMGLKSLEQVKAITLFAEQFTVENELLTPTMKTKRPALRKRFEKDVAAMYQSLGV